MAIHDLGSVAVTNGSATVTGSGTNWFGALQVGWMFRGPDGLVYAIDSVVSDSELTLSAPYTGATASGQAYFCFPTMSLAGDLAAAFRAIQSEFQDKIDTALAGIYPFGTSGAPGLRFQGDADTGMRRIASNRLGLVTGGIDALTLENGLAGGSAVQSNALAATAGLLLRTGAFGLGETGAAPHVDDLDTTGLPTGFYRYTGGTLGTRPNGVGSGTNGGVLVIRANATSFVQFLWRNHDGTTGIYHRKYKDLAWSDWVELYNNTTIVGTVAESSGVPTGAIIESASNANGNYIRHADGTQICSHQLELPYAAAARLGAFWTYPAQFAAAPPGRAAVLMTAATTPAVADLGIAQMTIGGIASCEVRQWRGNTAADFQPGDTVTMAVTAIGRWH